MHTQHLIRRILEPQFHFGECLLGTGSMEERIRGSLALALEILETQTKWTLLESLSVPLGLTPEGLRSLADAVVGISHVGFLLPGGIDEGILGPAALAAGLALGASFPSEVFCKELAALADCDVIPTQIFRLSGANQTGQRISVELFVPEAKPSQVRSWIAAGIGTHVGFRVGSREAVGKIHTTLASCEEYIPRFMMGGPKENRADDTTVLYYDLPIPASGGSLRFEFCHSPRD